MLRNVTFTSKGVSKASVAHFITWCTSCTSLMRSGTMLARANAECSSALMASLAGARCSAGTRRKAAAADDRQAVEAMRKTHAENRAFHPCCAALGCWTAASAGVRSFVDRALLVTPEDVPPSPSFSSEGGSPPPPPDSGACGGLRNRMVTPCTVSGARSRKWDTADAALRTALVAPLLRRMYASLTLMFARGPCAAPQHRHQERTSSPRFPPYCSGCRAPRPEVQAPELKQAIACYSIHRERQQRWPRRVSRRQLEGWHAPC